MTREIVTSRLITKVNGQSAAKQHNNFMVCSSSTRWWSAKA